MKIDRNENHLIVLDCDGTLLSDEKKILPKTKEYLLELERRGHIITMASGRPARAVLPFYQELGCEGPFISNNGALIVDPESPEPLFKRQFDREMVRDLLSHFSIDDFVNLVAEDDTCLYFLHPDDTYENYFHPQGRKLVIGDITTMDHDDLNCLIMTISGSAPDLAAQLERVTSSYDDLAFRFWDEERTIGEIYFRSVNKWTAVDRLREIYHLDREHVICFGDGENDVDMISGAGIGVAMRNATPALKSVADIVTTEDNNHEGIYLTLRDLFEG